MAVKIEERSSAQSVHPGVDFADVEPQETPDLAMGDAAFQDKPPHVAFADRQVLGYAPYVGVATRCAEFALRYMAESHAASSPGSSDWRHEPRSTGISSSTSAWWACAGLGESALPTLSPTTAVKTGQCRFRLANKRRLDAPASRLFRR
jgi:hypothetical protein